MTARETRAKDGQILNEPRAELGMSKKGPKEESLNQAPVDGNEGMPSKKKKKKKPAGTKLERRMKREEEQLKALYGPKDSHVKLISASMLEKLQGVRQHENSSTKSSLTLKQSSQQDKAYNSLFADNDFPSFGSSTNVKPSSVESAEVATTTNLDKHFPSLLTSSSDPVVTKTVTSSSSPGLLKAPEPIIPSSSKKKLSKKPIIINLDDLIVKKTSMKDLSKTKVKKRADDMSKRYSSNATVGNTLDSSGPMFIHRGKMREKPKKKKPTKLKMAIMISRSIRVEQKKSTPSDKSVAATTISSESPPNNENDSSWLTVNLPSVTVLKDVVPQCGTVGSALTTTNNTNHHNLIENRASQSSSKPDEIDGDRQEGGTQIITKDTPTINDESLNSKEDITTTENHNIFVALLNTAIKENNQKESINQNEEQGESGTEANDKVVVVNEEVICKAKEALHTRKFRPYCDMYTSKELHGHVIALLKELHRFQDRLYHSDSIKYKTKRRFIHGIKDTINSLKINKVGLVIFAPDIESSNSEGGLDEKIEEIKGLAKEKNVPVIYSGNRFVLGKPIFCKTAVSVISILDRQGAESLYFKVLEEADRLREKYETNLAQKIQEIIDLKS